MKLDRESASIYVPKVVATAVARPPAAEADSSGADEDFALRAADLNREDVAALENNMWRVYELYCIINTEGCRVLLLREDSSSPLVLSPDRSSEGFSFYFEGRYPFFK
jgi:hypothetical protein